MNSKVVLKKIMALLSTDKEMNFTYAKLADGTIVESPTFDVGEPLEVVSEDGTKSPAPDGEHELSLKDESGNENLIKVITEGGIIKERENVELETVETEPIPAVGNEDEENVMPTPEGSVEMAEETEEVEPLPSTDEESMEDMPVEDKKDIIEELQVRIEELSKKIAKLEEVIIVTESEEEEMPEEEMEEELPKLDGAPIESMKLSAIEKNRNNFGKKIENTQSKFLSKLYK